MAKSRLKAAADAAEDQLKAGVKRLQSELPGVRRRLEQAATAVKRRAAREQDSEPEPVMAPPGTEAEEAAAARANRTPDESWTVADLRAEAKRRGLAGYSRKNKAELLADLRS